jgi:hypothetical protein
MPPRYFYLESGCKGMKFFRISKTFSNYFSKKLHFYYFRNLYMTTFLLYTLLYIGVNRNYLNIISANQTEVEILYFINL